MGALVFAFDALVLFISCCFSFALNGVDVPEAEVLFMMFCICCSCEIAGVESAGGDFDLVREYNIKTPDAIIIKISREICRFLFMAALKYRTKGHLEEAE